jgi:hypothetical protein
VPPLLLAHLVRNAVPGKAVAGAVEVRYGSWLCENSKTKFARKNFVSSFVNFKTNSAGDRCRKKTIEKTILRLPGALAFLHSLGQEPPHHLTEGAAERPLKAAAPSSDRRGRGGPLPEVTGTIRLALAAASCFGPRL